MFGFRGTSRFQVLGELGRGGMGVVYEAIDRERDERVAIKALMHNSPELLYRMKQEFRSLQELAHPNLCRLGELYEHDGQWFFTMQLVEGDDFLSYVAPGSHRNGALANADTMARHEGDVVMEIAAPTWRFDEARLRDTLQQLALGLHALHSAGKVHRDVKPTNTKVATGGRLVLLDFGLVSDIVSGDPTDNAPLGTAAYMAPEQAAASPARPAMDWYAMGALLYHALTGRAPYLGPPLQVLIDKQQHAPAPPGDIAEGVPEDLDKLCAALLRIDPRARPDVQEIFARLQITPTVAATGLAISSQHTASPAFVGRDRELQALRDAASAAREGNCVSVFVHGESGIGKSTLVRKFVAAARAQEPETVVLSGRCYENESVPFKAFDGVIDSLTSHLRSLPLAECAALVPRRASLLPRLFPVLARVAPIAQARGSLSEVKDPLELRSRVFRALRELLAALADTRPVIIVIDDMQWMDRDSLPILRDLMRPPDAPSLLLLGLSRSGTLPGESPDSPGALPHALGADVRRLTLEPLGREAAAALASELRERSGLGSAVDIDRLIDESGGHPMFLDQLMLYSASVGQLSSRGPALDDAIWARIVALPAAQRELVELASLAGEELERDTLRLAAAQEPEEFSQHTSALHIAQLLSGRGTRDADPIEPYHDRVREGVLTHLDADVRADYHARLAVALESSARAAERPELLLRHFEAAGDLERAAVYARRAAERANRALAFGRAVELYERVLALSDGLSSAEERELRVALADACAHAGQLERAAREYLAAAEGLERGQAIELRWRAMQALLRGGHVSQGVPLASALLREVGLTMPKSRAATIARILYGRAWVKLRGLRFRPRAPEEIPRETTRRLEVLWAVQSGMAFVNPYTVSALESACMRHAFRAGDTYRASLAMGTAFGYESLRGHRARDKVEPLVERAYALADESGQPHARGTVAGLHGFAMFAMGDFRASDRIWYEAEEFLRERCVGIRYELAFCRMNRLGALMLLGNFREIVRLVPRYLDESVEQGDAYLAALVRSSRSSVYWLLEDAADEGRAQLATVPGALGKHDTFQVRQHHQLDTLSNYCLYEGDPGQARTLVRTYWPELRSSLLLRMEIVSVLAWFLRGRCEVAAASPGDRADLREVERCIARIEKHDADYGNAFACLLRAAVAHRRGDDAAAALLADAARRFAEVGMDGFATFARRRQGQLVAGDEGARLVAEADRWLRDQGARDPERLAATFAPGFD